ncbi:10138_t:CDS:2, partial [Gigaspora margarita]
MSTTALMKAGLDEILGMQYPMFEICKETRKVIYTCPDSFEFDEIINMADNFLTTQENTDDMIHINENNAVSELNKDEIEINNTN